MTTEREQFAEDVRCGLAKRPRELPSRYLYDALGSALFEAICLLPWYPITRAEFRLLQAHGAEAIAHASPARLVELGPGSGEKLRTLIEAAPTPREPFEVHVVDVSRRALELSSQTLARADVRIAAHRARYEAGLRQAIADGAGSTLVLFLGSNIGNFDAAAAGAFLGRLRDALAPGDTLLLGADLVKPEAELLLAYDDPLGVTAAFNRNLLARINRELGGDFDLGAFAHRAVWNARASRMEMHLVAAVDTRVHIDAAGVTTEIARGEAIWTESSHKYEKAGLGALLGRAGFRILHTWIDDTDRFALALAAAD